MSDPDEEIVAIQRAQFEASRLAHRWIIVEGLEGYEVHEHTIDGVAPCSVYQTKAEAAARLLQLLDISEPVTPQNWPERVCIGIMQKAEDSHD